MSARLVEFRMLSVTCFCYYCGAPVRMPIEKLQATHFARLVPVCTRHAKTKKENV